MKDLRLYAGLYTIKKEGTLNFKGGTMRARLARKYAKSAMLLLREESKWYRRSLDSKKLNAEAAENWAIAIEIVKTIKLIHESKR